MATQTVPEIVLYDLACTKGICFSPVVWRIRLMLNYKRIPYKTVFVEFPDIQSVLKELGIEPNESASGHIKYTVPAIHHVPTNIYMMDSVPIAEFLELTYPDPPLKLTSELGREIETKARAVAGPAMRLSVTPREMNILSPRSQEYFRRTREATLGRRLEDMLDPDEEEKLWDITESNMPAVSELLHTHEAEGPFVLGSQPSMADFLIAGSLQSTRVIDEGVFQRISKFPGYKKIYEACLPYMEKKD
ncbi:hypothetical protein H072_6186 [Dactylellina haptotyla CBS 200.50]|uniref:Uncharacterized protein n=1 Tax=Dactylellina haptotyla (strain CBS 200.50) TaxID=1284197 RepID=S8AAL1_DACHA|nr:hypothetical protein H072_6186 [Dactylellina haptotyla CBS 200.50]